MKNLRKNYKKIIVFILLLLLFSVPFYVLIGKQKNTDIQTLYSLVLMLCPGMAAIITQLVFQKNLKGFGWHWGKTKYILLSFLLPIFYCLIIFVPVWLCGLAEFSSIELGQFLADEFEIQSFSNSFQLIGFTVLYVLVIGLIGGVFALGEELGWRGFLLPELTKNFGFVKSSLISGVIWAGWHFPLFLFGNYSSHVPYWYELIFVTIGMVGIGFLMNFIRLRSNSLWTAVIFHTSHNISMQEIFPALTQETDISQKITGEFGVGIAILAIIVIIFFQFNRRFMPVIDAPEKI